MALNQTFEDVITVPVKLTAAVSAGQLVTTGRIIGVAMVGGAVGDTVSVAVKGGFVYSAVFAAVTATGDPVYFDSAKDRLIDAAHTQAVKYLVGYAVGYYAAGTYNYIAGNTGTTGAKSSAVEFVLTPSGHLLTFSTSRGV